MHAVTRYIIRVRDGNGDLVGYATEIGAAGTLAKEARYRTKSLPAAGAMPLPEDFGEQLSLL